jgi:hypothetical protein
MSVSRRFTHVALTALLLAAVAGCRRDDPRIRNLEVGMVKDSAVAAMGGAAERPYAYLVGGQYIEALIWRRKGVEGPMDELGRNQLTPLVVVDGALSGWGWAYWDSVAAAHGIPVTPQP